MTDKSTAPTDASNRTSTSVEVLVGLLAERYIASLIAANDNRAPTPQKDQ